MGNLAAVMNMMKNRWDDVTPGGGLNLAVHLDVPGSKQEEISGQHSSLTQQRVAFASYCTHFLPGFSWAMFSGALYYCDEREALKEARRYIKRDEGKLCSIMRSIPTVMSWSSGALYSLKFTI